MSVAVEEKFLYLIFFQLLFIKETFISYNSNNRNTYLMVFFPIAIENSNYRGLSF